MYFILENIFRLELLCEFRLSMFLFDEKTQNFACLFLPWMWQMIFIESLVFLSRTARISFHNLSASLMHKLQTVLLRRCIKMRFFFINVLKHWLWTKQNPKDKTMLGRRRTECLVWLEIGSNNFLLLFDMLEYIIKSPLFESFSRSQLDKKNKTFEIRFMIDST